MTVITIQITVDAEGGVQVGPPAVTNSAPSASAPVQDLRAAAEAIFADELIPLPPEPAPTGLGPFRAMALQQARGGTCPVHSEAWKSVPAGISKASGRPYDAFRACPVKGCRERPAA